MPTFEEIARTPRLKIDRAKHHINDLSGRIEAYFALKPQRVVLARPDGGNRAQPIIRCEIPIPPEFSLIIGDAIHNLRSSLDHSIWQMVGKTVLNPDIVQYPFPKKAVDEKGFRHTIESRQIQGAGENVIKEIIALNAQPGGDELLYGVHALDIADKHKLIVTTTETMMYQGCNMRSRDPNITVNWLFPEWVRTAPNEKLGGMMANWIEEEAEVQPTFFISLEDRAAFVRQEAVTVLRNMTDRIDEAVTTLIRAFLS